MLCLCCVCWFSLSLCLDSDRCERKEKKSKKLLFEYFCSGVHLRIYFFVINIYVLQTVKDKKLTWQPTPTLRWLCFAVYCEPWLTGDPCWSERSHLLTGCVCWGGGTAVGGGGSGQKRPRRRRWRRNRTAMKHQTVRSSGAAERDLWPQAVQSINHLHFILQCSRTGRGRILEEEGGARGALRITANVFGESFWETQKKTMQIICRVKFIVSFSINEKYAKFFPLGFFVLKCIS